MGDRTPPRPPSRTPPTTPRSPRSPSGAGGGGSENPAPGRRARANAMADNQQSSSASSASSLHSRANEAHSNALFGPGRHNTVVEEQVRAAARAEFNRRLDQFEAMTDDQVRNAFSLEQMRRMMALVVQGQQGANETHSNDLERHIFLERLNAARQRLENLTAVQW